MNTKSPSSKTQGKNMFLVFLLGFFGCGLKIACAILTVWLLLKMVFGDNERPVLEVFSIFISIGVTILGAYLE